METASRVSIIVLNWNGLKYLRNCLDSIAGQSVSLLEVILVDNGSTDGSVEFVKKHYPWVKVVEIGRNLGLSSRNLGLREAKGRYIAFVDNDIYLDKKWIEERLKVASLPSVGVVGGSVISFDPPHKPVFFPNRFFPSLKLPWAILSHSSIDKAVEIDHVQGCGLFVAKEVFEKIGTFDPVFFLWNDDLDFCVRARRASFRVVFTPKSVMYHKIGGFRARASRCKLIKQFVEANVKFARKSYPLWHIPFAMVSVALANLIFLIQLFLSR
jgi:GT2 family glycosyltransferase